MDKPLCIYTVQYFHLDKLLEMELLSQMVCKILVPLILMPRHPSEQI